MILTIFLIIILILLVFKIYNRLHPKKIYIDNYVEMKNYDSDEAIKSSFSKNNQSQYMDEYEKDNMINKLFTKKNYKGKSTKIKQNISYNILSNIDGERIYNYRSINMSPGHDIVIFKKDINGNSKYYFYKSISSPDLERFLREETILDFNFKKHSSKIGFQWMSHQKLIKFKNKIDIDRIEKNGSLNELEDIMINNYSSDHNKNNSDGYV